MGRVARWSSAVEASIGSRRSMVMGTVYMVLHSVSGGSLEDPMAERPEASDSL